LSETNSGAPESIKQVLDADTKARERAEQRVLALSEGPRATSFV
jgi:hypothetical protein